MVDFVSAQELKKKYQVYGSFYNICVDNKKIVKCRNCLDIFNKNDFTDLEDSYDQCTETPDALAVMMNPGSSRPSSKLKNYSEPLFKMSELVDKIFCNKMVLAKPDTTQYQIMRVMNNQKWNCVRVLNLSDIREPKCNTFFKRVKDFENNYGHIHSIFSKEREKERNRAFILKQKDSPILVAWGCNKSLLNLADRVMTYIVPEKVVGLSYSITNLYRHPLPSLHKSKIEWLEKINYLLNKK